MHLINFLSPSSSVVTAVVMVVLLRVLAVRGREGRTLERKLY